MGAGLLGSGGEQQVQQDPVQEGNAGETEKLEAIPTYEEPFIDENENLNIEGSDKPISDRGQDSLTSNGGGEMPLDPVP